MVFYLKRTFKVLVTLIILVTVCNIFNLDTFDTLNEYLPTIVLTVAMLDVSEEVYSRTSRLLNWLVDKVIGSSFSKRWDLEERINDIRLKYALPIAVVAIVVFFLVRWVLF